MPLIPEYQAMMDQLKEVGAPPIQDMAVAEVRAMYKVSQPVYEDLSVFLIKQSEISGPAGPIPVRIYVPSAAGPHPMIFLYHGGGWVIGDLDTADSEARELCVGTNALVISVDYRLAPENQFPAAVDDSFAVFKQANQLAQQFNGDPERIAVAGDSAGGNLAAVMAQMARDQNGPAICFQLLVYPVTDGTNLERNSYHEMANGYLLTRDAMVWFWDHYCPEEDRGNPLASPLLADNFSNLPPALVMTAKYDPLCDEGEEYAKRLSSAGTSVEHKHYEGYMHGFFSHTPMIPSIRESMEDACSALRRVFKS